MLQGRSQRHIVEGKAKDMTLKAKTKDMMYDAKFKTLQKLYLGHIASNSYKIAQKAMPFSLVVTKILIALELHTKGAFHWDIRWPLASRRPISTGAQWNAFGRLVGHPPAAEMRRDRKLGCVVGASDTIMFINGYHRNQPIDGPMHP